MRKRRVLSLILVCVLVFTRFSGGNIVLSAEEVTFADPVLEDAVRWETGKWTGTITKSDVMGITSLFPLSSDKLTNLQGIEELENLESLTLYSQEVTDISKISGLTKLTSLILADNKISDISPIKNLANLELLSLSMNEISDISSLEGMVNIKSLGLNSNNLTDVSVIESMTGLESIGLNNNNIDDISFLSGNSKLTGFQISDDSDPGFVVTKTLVNLDNLGLNLNSVTDISFVKDLVRLDSLTLQGPGVKNIEVVGDITNLTDFTLIDTIGVDVSPVSDLHKLEELNLRSNNLMEIPSLQGLNSLGNLVLRDNNISDLSPIEGMALDYLYIGKNRLDISDGSDTMRIIKDFESQGTTVRYDDQKEAYPPEVVVPELDYDLIDVDMTEESIVSLVEDEVLELDEGQKTDSDSLDELANYAEYAIAQAGTEKVALGDGDSILIDNGLVLSSALEASKVKEEIEGSFEENGIELNRAISKDVRVEVELAEDVKSLVIKVDESLIEADVDKVIVDMGSVTLTYAKDEIEELLKTSNTFEIRWIKHSPGQVSEDYREGIMLDEVGYLGKESIYRPFSREALSWDEMDLSFKKDDEPVDTSDVKISVGLEVSEGDPDYTSVHIKRADGDEAIGGNYNKKNGTLEIETDETGTYFVKENKVSFDDLGGLDGESVKAIEVLAAKGMINGVGDGEFNPNGAISRAAFTKIIVRALYLYDSSAVSTFSDVADGAWYQAYVASSKKAGLINGYNDNTFKPNNIITKQEMVKISAASLHEKKGYYYPTNTSMYVNRYSDLVAQWAQKYLALADREGIVVQNSAGMFYGGKGMTRADAAVMLYRLFNRL